MIADDTFGLAGFKLVKSSEQAMLAETQHRIKEGKPVVFFGWQPHLMNVDNFLWSTFRRATTCSDLNDGGPRS